jgi:hypothetical protein
MFILMQIQLRSRRLKGHMFKSHDGRVEDLQSPFSLTRKFEGKVMQRVHDQVVRSQKLTSRRQQQQQQQQQRQLNNNLLPFPSRGFK